MFDHICDLEEALRAMNWRHVDCVALIIAAMHPSYTMLQTLNPSTRKAFHLMDDLHYISNLTTEQYYAARKKAVGY